MGIGVGDGLGPAVAEAQVTPLHSARCSADQMGACGCFPNLQVGDIII